MFLIHCPCCGDCNVTEFSYGGDATLQRPAANASFDDWYDYVYLRSNPKGLHDEYWHHAAGCRQWLKVRRDTVTHVITVTCAAHASLDEVAS